MPRIEYFPPGHEEGHDGSPTVDLCRECAKGLKEGFTIRYEDHCECEELSPGTKIGSTFVSHPRWTGAVMCQDEYSCAECSHVLEEEDN